MLGLSRNFRVAASKDTGPPKRTPRDGKKMLATDFFCGAENPGFDDSQETYFSILIKHDLIT